MRGGSDFQIWIIGIRNKAVVAKERNDWNKERKDATCAYAEEVEWRGRDCDEDELQTNLNHLRSSAASSGSDTNRSADSSSSSGIVVGKGSSVLTPPAIRRTIFASSGGTRACRYLKFGGCEHA
jgi:hypothetical protein